VLRKLGFVEKSIHARDGRWFTVRIMPYRTLDDRIDGLVITFADITASKMLEAQLREQHAVLERQVAAKSMKTEHTMERLPAATGDRDRNSIGAGKALASGKT